MPLKAKSQKRRKREAEARPFREALIKRVGECEGCECSQISKLCVHEIARGPHRQKALDKPYAVLVLCSACNLGPFNDKREWPEARQLAQLAKSRPLDFDLAAYLQLTSPKAPRRITIEEVLDWMDEDYLTKNNVADRVQVDRRAVQNWVESGELPAMDARVVGASRPLYRIAWKDFLAFCERRRVAKDEVIVQQGKDLKRVRLSDLR